MVKINVTDRSGRTHSVGGSIGQTLMEVLRDNELDVEALCGGSCACATCHVFVDPVWLDRLPARQDGEEDLLSSTNSYRPEASRLSCQIELADALDGMTVTVAPRE